MVGINRVFYFVTLLSVAYAGLIKNDSPMQKPLSIMETQKLKGQELMTGLKRKQKQLEKRTVESFDYVADSSQNAPGDFEEPEIDTVTRDPFEDTVADIIDEGKEKWAIFLSTSDNKKFKRLIKYLKTSMETGREQSIITSLTNKQKEKDLLGEKTKGINNKNQFKFTSDATTHDSATLGQLNNFFGEVALYTNSEGLSYMVQNADIYESQNLMEYADIDIQSKSLQSLSTEDIAPEEAKWLKDNVMRRSQIIQHLLSGELENAEVELDEIRYREGNLFLDPDDNEFILSAGASSHLFKNKIGLVLLLIVTELAFFLL